MVVGQNARPAICHPCDPGAVGESQPAVSSVNTRRLVHLSLLVLVVSHLVRAEHPPFHHRCKMGNFLAACCQPSGKEKNSTYIVTGENNNPHTPFTDRKGKDNLSVSISIGDCSDPIKDVKGTVKGL